MIKHAAFLFIILSSILLQSCRADAPEDEAIYERLVEWFSDNGVVYSTEVGLGYPTGVIASAPIEASEKKKAKIVTVPQTMTISEKTAMDSELGPVFKENPTIESTGIIALFLLYEKNKENSRWKPYIDSFPKELDTPMFWTKKEQKLLTGSWVLDRVKADEKALKENYKEVVVDILFQKYPEIFDPAVYTEDEYIWIWNVIWGRAFWFESTGLIMVPMLDSFSHHNEAKTEIYFEEGQVSLFTKDSVEANHEIFINRGQRPNNDLLRLYGFILPANQFNLAFIEDTLGEKDPIRLGLKKAILNKHNMLGPPYPYGDTSDGLWVKKEIPLHVIAFYRIKFWEPTKAQLAAWKDSETIPDVNPSKMINEENEKKTIVGFVDRLEQIIDRYPEGYKDDKALLQGKELKGRERVAVQLRYQEKKILNDARTTLMTPKKSLDRATLL